MKEEDIGSDNDCGDDDDKMMVMVAALRERSDASNGIQSQVTNGRWQWQMETDDGFVKA